MSFRPAALAAILLGACGDDAGLPDARPPADARPTGQIALSWSLSHGGAPQTCASVGATSVSVEMVPIDQPFGTTESFSCAAGMGTTGGLAPNTYRLSASVTGGGTLDGPIVLPDVVVRSNEVTAADPVAFDVEPTGSLAFRITTPATGGNCASTGAMGAGITGMVIELRDAGGTCVPTTFQIAAGAVGMAGTYVSDCSGARHGCIEADQQLRADGVVAGQHSMMITGAIGVSPCWTRTSQFVTRANNILTTLNPQALSYDPLVPGCPAM